MCTAPSPHHNHFTALFPGPPRWAGARRELLQGKIYWGRHTDHPARRHSIQTNQCPPPPSSPYFLQAGCPSCCPTNSVKALKATSAFRLGRRRSSSPQRCYLHRLRTLNCDWCAGLQNGCGGGTRSDGCQAWHAGLCCVAWWQSDCTSPTDGVCWTGMIRYRTLAGLASAVRKLYMFIYALNTDLKCIN